MPLDGHLYLVSQGWRGKGTGLRDGALTRPLAIPQKKNLAGLGKDRDEAFPFWDHLFTVAAKSIQLKCSGDSDGESNTGNSSCIKSVIKRTATGIPSNRRPVEASATSTPSTPCADSDSSRPSVNLLAAAKRNAAKQSLYSRFFRGPVLGPGDEEREPMSGDTIQIEGVATKSGKMNTNSKAVVDAVKGGRASKRKRDEGGSGEVVAQKKKRKKREEGLNALKSKGENEKKKDRLTASLSFAEGPAQGVDSESEKKRRKAERQSLKVKKREVERTRSLGMA